MSQVFFTEILSSVTWKRLRSGCLLKNSRNQFISSTLFSVFHEYLILVTSAKLKIPHLIWMDASPNPLSSRNIILPNSVFSFSGDSTVGWPILSPTRGFSSAAIAFLFFSFTCWVLQERSYNFDTSRIDKFPSITLPLLEGSTFGKPYFPFICVESTLNKVQIYFFYWRN